MRRRRQLAALAAAGLLALPLAACGEDDVREGVQGSAEDVRDKARELEGDLDSLSKKDLRRELRELEGTVEGGSKDAKREARELERKIERELEQR